VIVDDQNGGHSFMVAQRQENGHTASHTICKAEIAC